MAPGRVGRQLETVEHFGCGRLGVFLRLLGAVFPLVLGVWWKRANRQGAIAGMALGFLAGSFYLYHVRFAGGTPILGLDHLRFGIVGMAVSLVAMVGVSLVTEEPDAETQAMVDAIRIPGGATVLNDEH